MKIKRQLVCGRLYEAYSYTHCILPRENATVRQKKQKMTAEAKKKINQRQSALKLMRLLCLNFQEGEDIVLELDAAGPPPDRAALLEMLRKFLRAMRREYKRRRKTLKYISVIEAHDREGRGVRMHAHLVINTIGRDDMGRRQDWEIIKKCWTFGGIGLRRLHGGRENYRDLAEYLLKTYRQMDRGAKCWMHSRNLDLPRAFERSVIQDGTRLETPPGVRLISWMGDANEWGGYEYLIGYIEDKQAFERWQKGRRQRRKPGRRRE